MSTSKIFFRVYSSKTISSSPSIQPSGYLLVSGNPNFVVFSLIYGDFEFFKIISLLFLLFIQLILNNFV